jgi:hypothetical protein
MMLLKRAFGLTIIGAILTFSPSAAGVELKGDYQQGSHDFNGHIVKLFAFTFDGALTAQAIDTETFKILKQLDETKTTAVKVAKTADATYRSPASLKHGEIFVFGWWNTTKRTYAWIAADTNGAEYPVHRWLAKDGAYGVLDTTSGEKHMLRTWKVDGQHPAVLELDARAGWLRWYVTGGE